jgi:zinc transport system substrate-binding protein
MNKPAFFLAALALLAALVSPGPAASLPGDGRILVMTSIFPLREFVREVGGQRVDAAQLLPPGAEIHDWQPSARQIIDLNRARLLVCIGGGLEPWAESAVRSRRRQGLPVLEVSQGLTLMDRDPHVWLDLARDRSIVDAIRDALIAIDPAGAGVYGRNAAAYKADLRALDDRFKAGLANCANRVLVTGGHAAFGYLAARYGLTQVALYGLSPDAEPTPRRLIEVTREVKEKHIRAVFFESTVNPKLARVLAKETGAEVLPLNDGANLTPEQASSGTTFLQIMDQNLENLRHGLGCR